MKPQAEEKKETVYPLRVKRLVENAIVPKKANEYAAGYDLYSSNAEDITIEPQGKALIPTGCSFSIPHGNYGRIAPRSGLAWKKHLDVGAGVIDSDYRGEVRVVIFNLSQNEYVVTPGERIAQMIIEKVVPTEIEEVDDLEVTERGAGGFGSTGVKLNEINNDINKENQIIS
ncbi:unnamed protein product [Moneuplotes crassus]|uniref:Deoxyuridine 5'-triphosphate nucleotidohydrolase n=1 Tax=Euplotes crassus TaxID=5936 RepID=A0AAD1XY73_EUPCR|nr:unnamed protein product [Moneuplotes crassus]